MKKLKSRMLFFLYAFLLSSVCFSQEKDTISLDDMIGQMVMVGLNNYDEAQQKKQTLDAIAEGRISGIILFEKDLQKTDTKRNLSQLIWELQEAAKTPLFIAIDEEGGKVNRLKPKYGFPKTATAAALGALDNVDTTRHYANQTAKNLNRFGFNVNFAPTVDVNINPENPVIAGYKRSYSSDPRLITKHAWEVIGSHDAQQVATVLKHFPGHGSSSSDTHLGIADVSNSWRFEELSPYKSLIDSGVVKAIMSSHIVNRTLDEDLLPATLSKKMIDGVLRRHLGFNGVVFSDDMHMGAITQHYGFEEAVVLAINAGVDVLVFSNNITIDDITHAGSLHGLIKKAVSEGEIEVSQIQAAYQRIMTLKEELGLLNISYKAMLDQKLKLN